MVSDDSEKLDDLLHQRSDWHIWFVEFGLTHQVLCIALHPGTYPRHWRILCAGCVRVEGDVQGGPYRLSVRSVDWRGERMTELASADGSFRVIGERFKLTDRNG